MCKISTVFWIISSIFCLHCAAQGGFERAEELLEHGEITRARLLFEEINDKPEALERLGDIASFEKKWDLAIGYYDNLVEEYPESARYNFKLGGAMGMKAMQVPKIQAALMLGDIKFHLNKAAELDKTNPEVRRALVEFYMQIPGIVGGSREVAEDFARQLKDINPIDYYLAKAYIYKTDGEAEAARNMVKNAILLASEDKSLIRRNYLYYELGTLGSKYNLYPEMSIAFLEKYIQNYGYKDLKSPDWARYRIARIKADQDRKGEALALIEQVLQNNPDFEEAKREKERILKL
ncbi:tetratricopeptide repeat protein [Salegentibacter chungangensis]|uniref:Tetratricopeptide repeat protein n=1 Tax=Salegentibacter chungangensis TaxID=1335724 RepID=A0ABW3NY57_9FLAO